ncbi:MAG: hypothetical protein H6R18_2027 [Proteobacteria bacterium]|nr:hypothetical protein [Pseudomonadota bacterium]
MKLDHLTSTTMPHAHEALRPAHVGTESLVRRVDEAERTAPDRDQSMQEKLAQQTRVMLSEPTTAAYKVREVVAKLIRLGPQARKLVKKSIPVDEEA